MSSKKIIVSSGGGKYQEISASIDDGILSGSNISVKTGSFSGQETFGVLQVVNGKIESITGSNDTHNYKINYSTTAGKFVVESDSAGDLGGDLKDLSSRAKVKSVSNVTGGVLASAYGGTGTGSYTAGSLVTTNGNGPTYTGNADKAVAVGADGNFTFIDKSVVDFTPMTGTLVFLYTGSVGSVTAPMNWIKPGSSTSPFSGKPRFIRVICQGGGGGGVGGGGGSSGAGFRAGSAGAGGGYSDVIFNSISLPDTISVQPGFGGTGSVLISTNAQSGGSSSFGEYLSAGGGNSGTTGTSNTVKSIGGFGYIQPGSSGGAAATNIYPDNLSVIAGPGGGSGNQQGGAITGIVLGGAAGVSGSTESVRNGSFNSIKYYSFNKCFINGSNSLSDFPSNLVCSGGGCGYTIGVSSAGQRAGTGGSPTFGGGGGGGGGHINQTSWVGYGGNGGAGYVLIICY